MKALIINGPNLNLVGTRNTSVYGEKSLSEYLENLKRNYSFEVFQSNVEGEIINKLQEANGQNFESIILNQFVL